MKLSLFKFALPIFAAAALAVGCKEEEIIRPANGPVSDQKPQETPQDPDVDGSTGGGRLALTPVEKLGMKAAVAGSHADDTRYSSLMMMYGSLVRLDKSATGADWPNYARLKKMSNGNYILFTHQSNESGSNGWDTFYATSPDLKTWTPRGFLYERYVKPSPRVSGDKRVFTNANGIVLADGTLLAFASYRSNLSYNYEDCNLCHGIVVMRSADNGNTWSEPLEIYHGANWEAHMVQLPSGKIQCYFSESRPWISGGHSGTSLVESSDNGYTWSPALDSEPRRVVRQLWYNDDQQQTLYTDQMPVLTALNGTSQLAGVFESSVSCKNGDTSYKISLAYSDADGGWTDIRDDNGVGPADRQSNLFDGAAPFIVQFPSGETVISYGTGGYMTMRMGDSSARTFGREFRALPYSGYWGCMEIDGPNRLIAAQRSSAGGEHKVAVARFWLNHRITASPRTVTVDGSNAEWSVDDEALFVGSKSNACATLRSSQDSENVYFLVEVLDDKISNDDYVQIYFCPENDGNTLTSDAFRLKLGSDGLRGTDVWSGGSWTKQERDITVASACDGTPSDNSDTDTGWLAEICISKSTLGVAGGRLMVNVALVDMLASGEDAIAPTGDKSTACWIPVVVE